MSHFECVEMVKTKDGSLFTSESKATEYVIDKLCEEVNEVLKTKIYVDLKYCDLCSIIDALCGSMENAEKLKSILDTHID